MRFPGGGGLYVERFHGRDVAGQHEPGGIYLLPEVDSIQLFGELAELFGMRALSVYKPIFVYEFFEGLFVREREPLSKDLPAEGLYVRMIHCHPCYVLPKHAPAFVLQVIEP